MQKNTPSIIKPQVISLLLLVVFKSLHLRNKIFPRKQNKTNPNKLSPRQNHTLELSLLQNYMNGLGTHFLISGRSSAMENSPGKLCYTFYMQIIGLNLLYYLLCCIIFNSSPDECLHNSMRWCFSHLFKLFLSNNKMKNIQKNFYKIYLPVS